MDHHLVAADGMQIGIHRAHAADLGREFHAFDKIFLQHALFVAVEVGAEAVEHVLIGAAKKAAGARRRIADAVGRRRLRHLAHGLDHRARGEVLASAARGFLRRAGEQFLVDGAFHVHRQGEPVHLVEQVDDELLQECRVVDLAARALEDDAQHAALDTELFQALSVVVLQGRAVER